MSTGLRKKLSNQSMISLYTVRTDNNDTWAWTKEDENGLDLHSREGSPFFMREIRNSMKRNIVSNVVRGSRGISTSPSREKRGACALKKKWK